MLPLALLLACGPARPPASAGSPSATACPPGTHVVEGWQGEYPGPIVHVREPLRLAAYREVCDAAPSVDCTVPPGLYHPWSPTPSDFRTIRAIQVYESQSDFVLDRPEGAPRVTVPAGATVEVLAYYGEGFCELRFAGATYDHLCPEMFNASEGPALFVERPLPPGLPAERQLFQAACLEGGSAWVEVTEALMAAPQVRHGEILGYGEVGPSAEP